MGWTEGSKQSAKYAKGEIERRASELSLEHQRRMFSSVGHGPR
jgi:hypothetical protein